MRETEGEIEICPGIIGPQLVIDDRFAVGGAKLSFTLGFDLDRWQYICLELRVRNVTPDALRQITIATDIKEILLTPEPVIKILPNIDHRDPWGLDVPSDIREAPTSRSLRWVAHLYTYGLAVESAPTKVVEEKLALPRATVSRWVRMARERGYLGMQTDHG